MARIKAKPIHRMSIAPVQMPMKNGFRTTPPPPVFDPATANATAYTTQQRFVFPNGACLPQPVPYNGQVQVFVSLINLFVKIYEHNKLFHYLISHSNSNNNFIQIYYKHGLHLQHRRQRLKVFMN